MSRASLKHHRGGEGGYFTASLTAECCKSPSIDLYRVMSGIPSQKQEVFLTLIHYWAFHVKARISSAMSHGITFLHILICAAKWTKSGVTGGIQQPLSPPKMHLKLSIIPTLGWPPEAFPHREREREMYGEKIKVVSRVFTPSSNSQSPNMMCNLGFCGDNLYSCHNPDNRAQHSIAQQGCKVCSLCFERKQGWPQNPQKILTKSRKRFGVSFICVADQRYFISQFVVERTLNVLQMW